MLERPPGWADAAAWAGTEAAPVDSSAEPAAGAGRMSALPPWLRAALTALGAALLFGSWATWVNRGQEWGAAAKAGAVQAGLSMVSTFGYSLLLEWFYRLTDSRRARLVLGCGVAPAVAIGMMSGAHTAAGTGNIAATVAPSAISGILFAVVYTLGVGLKAPARAPKG